MYSRSFLSALADSLRKNGVQERDIDYYIKKFEATHPVSSNATSMTYSEIDALAQSLTNEKQETEIEDIQQNEFNQEFEFPDFSEENISIDINPDAIDLPEDNALPIGNENIVRVDVTKKAHKNDGIKASPLFVFLFILTLPITFPLFAALCVLIGVLFLTNTLIIALSVILLVAIIAAGVTLSLVGIIYGITKVGKELPIALYEMGLGIAIGGVTMLLSVLIYNLCVKLSPKLYGKSKIFTKWLFGKIGKLYNAFKKECAK